MKPIVWRCVPLILFGCLAVFLWRGLSLDPQRLPASQIGQKIPDFDLPSLLGSETQRFTPAMMRDHPAILIVWASWCTACQEEQLFLSDLAQQGIPLFGLNYKDDPSDAKHWLAEWGNPYQAIGIDRQGKLAMDLGVYGAPEAYLLDAHGVIKHRYVGSLTAAVWQREFEPLLRNYRVPRRAAPRRYYKRYPRCRGRDCVEKRRDRI
ncbi:MAG: DsbE family thiol:disulfide interchange protein [Gammaproteobacteria bacterium]|nr:DsbE family thiol:disulfide interchange protein [Gammaproteobacteria bacterium]